LRRLTSILTNSDEQFPDILSPELTTWGVGRTLTAVVVGLAVDGYGVQPFYFFLASIVLILAVFVSFNKANKQLDAARELASV